MSAAIHIHRDIDDDARPIPYHIDCSGHTDPQIGQHYWFTLSTGHSYVTIHVSGLDELYHLGNQLIREAMRLDDGHTLDLMDSPGPTDPPSLAEVALYDVFSPSPEAVK